ncbi:MAG: OsmC family protein [Myxococcota bacterium]
MAVEMRAEAREELSCVAWHGPSGAVVETDAPADNQGRGAAFSPTDLLGAAFATCALTTMGIKGPASGIEFTTGKARVLKHMSAEPPRRIAELEVEFELPAAHTSDERAELERIAQNCPVALSLHPNTTLNVTFRYV